MADVDLRPSLRSEDGRLGGFFPSSGPKIEDGGVLPSSEPKIGWLPRIRAYKQKKAVRGKEDIVEIRKLINIKWNKMNNENLKLSKLVKVMR